MIQHYKRKFKHYQAGRKKKILCNSYFVFCFLYIRSLKRESHSAAQRLAEEMEQFMDKSSSDYDSDLEIGDGMDNKLDDTHKMIKVIQPITSYRYVHSLNGKLSLSKMKTDPSYRTYFLVNYADISKSSDISHVVIDDSDVDDNDDDEIIDPLSQGINSSVKQEHNLDDIREKTLEHDRQQIKGIHFANAGGNNLKIINDYSVTSNTCMLL
jgi:hypothetical protein